MKKAFTLAEIMIVLTLIGVLAGILIPIAVNSRPDENVAKFQKAHETLYNAINELKTSDKYYCNGDLGLKADCMTLTVNNNGNVTITDFCESLADVLSTKKVNCQTTRTTSGCWLLSNEMAESATAKVQKTVTPETIQASKEYFDSLCKARAKKMGQEIVTTDDITYYNTATTQFGVCIGGCSGSYIRLFSPPDENPANYADQNGFDISYKIFCVDVDGFDESVGSADCDDDNDICPFGYGIRADGKILPGARADEWLGKSITAED